MVLGAGRLEANDIEHETAGTLRQLIPDQLQATFPDAVEIKRALQFDDCGVRVIKEFGWAGADVLHGLSISIALSGALGENT